MSEDLDKELASALVSFVDDMRAKLIENNHKAGWEEMHPTAVLERLCEELADLMGTCTPRQALDRPAPELRTSRVLDTQREIMLCAIEHVHCAAMLLSRFRRGTPKELVVTHQATTGEAADVANFCMFLAHRAGRYTRGERR